MTDWKEPHGITIFCDDIRQEVGRKTSLMGVYGADMILGVPFPVVLPKLCLAIYINFDPRDPNDEDLELRIILPEESLESASLKSTIATAGTLADFKKGKLPSDEAFIRLSANVVLSPLSLKEGGTIKVRAVRGEEVFKLGSLSVTSRDGESVEVVDGGTF